MAPRLMQLLRVVQSTEGGDAIIGGRKIYILPTRYGVVFGVLLITMLIASINYANNPAFILTFLLTGVLVQAIFHTWRNLLGLHLRWVESDPAFAGETTHFHFLLSDPKGRAHYAIQMGFKDQQPVVVDMPAGRKTRISLPFVTRRRGILRPGRLILETRFPLGLLRAWCYLDIESQAIVWPRPVKGQIDDASPAYEGSQEGDRGVGTDDFVGHRGYRPGDSLGHVYWKALAGERGLLVKQFGGDRVNRLWLDFDKLPEQNTEIRLSILAEAVQELATSPVHFGLRLPNLEIKPDCGERHRRRCLDSLAQYGETP